MAKALAIQPAFLSQVLASKYPLSLEQAEAANHFFAHASDESDFFLLLVSRDRAGTEGLRKHFNQQIQAALGKRKSVIDRMGRKPEISDHTKSIYYSSWVYAACHVATTIPNLRTRTALAGALDIPTEAIAKMIEFLLQNGLRSVCCNCLFAWAQSA